LASAEPQISEKIFNSALWCRSYYQATVHQEVGINPTSTLLELGHKVTAVVSWMSSTQSPSKITILICKNKHV
jgi:hypothetical protein